MSAIYGKKLDIDKSYRERFAFKADSQHVKISHTPSTIDQNQDLEVRIPNLGENNVMVPGSLKLTFDLEITSSLNTRYSVNNLAKALITQMSVNYEGNEINTIQDFDIWQLYNDLWLSDKERQLLIEQGLDDDDGNVNKVRVKSHNAESAASVSEKAIAKVYGNRFCIPLGLYFEMTKHLPIVSINDRLSFVLRFAPYSNVIIDAGVAGSAKKADPDGSYKITNIALEFDKVEDRAFAKLVESKLSNVHVPYDRVLRHRVIPLNKSDTTWNIQVNVPSESLKGLALIFVDPESHRKSYNYQPETFYNPLISKVSITVEGEPNQLYSHGMMPKDMYDSAFGYFGHSSETGMSLGKFFTTGYCLFLDFRSTPDNVLHGSGKRLKNTSDGITLQIEKKADGAGNIKCYVFVLQDGQVNFEDGRCRSVGY